MTDGARSARSAGLHYSTDDAPGFTRERRGKAFVYRAANGRVVRSRRVLKRIAGLVLPPAWERVWIAADPRSHLQATGRDAKGRKQYRYHPSWTAVRDETKYHRMLEFAKALPLIRRHTSRDLRAPKLSRAQVLAAVVQLLERTNIRVGNEEYARDNGSHGLTTMRDRHVRVRAKKVSFDFRAKSGVRQRIDIEDARLAAAVRACQDLPGQTVFQYLDDDGETRAISSADVNGYLQDVTGQDFTAKDFRTWAGTLAAACALDELGAVDGKTACARAIVQAVDQVAKALGNTRAVSRKCYIHPAVLDAYQTGLTIGRLTATRGTRMRGLSQAEACVVALLRTATGPNGRGSSRPRKPAVAPARIVTPPARPKAA
jgi:DNA topoisomerase I